MAIEAVAFMDHGRTVAGLARKGRTRLHILVIEDSGVRVLHRPLTEERYCRPLMKGKAPYPVKRFARKVRAMGRPITAEAKELLKLAEGQ